MQNMTESNCTNIRVFRVNCGPAKARRRSNPTSTTSNETTPEPTGVSSRTSLSAETKRLICEDHLKNPKYTQEALATKYGCKRTTVAKIIKSKERWLSIDNDNANSKRFRQRSSRYPHIENALISWLQNEYSDITAVSDQILRSQARQYAQEFYTDKLTDFKASSSWVSSFKQKYIQCKSDDSPPVLMFENSKPPTVSETQMEQARAFIEEDSTINVLPQPDNIPSTDVSSTLAEKNNSMFDQLVMEFDVNQVETAQNIIDSASPNSTPSVSESNNNVKINNNNEETTTYEEQFANMQDYGDDMDSSCFENNDSDNNNNENNTRVEQPQPEILTTEQQTNTKLTAKQHLEAALAFYTSHSESNASMSANMIKLILQNDF